MKSSSKWQRPILQSVLPVIERSQHVSTKEDSVISVARWMAYEHFAGNIELPVLDEDLTDKWDSPVARIK
jgi:hypothetical protein